MATRRLRYSIGLLLASLMLLLGTRTPALAADGTDETRLASEPCEVIVVYRSGREEAFGSPAEDLSDPAGAYQVADSELLGEAGDGEACALVSLELSEGVSLDDALERIEERDEVAYAQPNYRYGLPGDLAPQSVRRVNDPKATYQYHLDPWEYVPGVYGWSGSAVRDAWDMARCNGQVTVAVLDSGCRVTHRDLAANIDTKHMRDVYYNRSAGTMRDDDGHGTAVCGIVAAQANNGTGVAGVSYNARILPIKVFGDGVDSSTSTAVLVRAYNYLRTLIRTNQLTNLHVINVSLAGYETDTEDEVLRECISTFSETYDVVTICSGGNNGDGSHESPRSYPCDFDECLSITSLTMGGENAWWSDFNAYKDLSAPGEGIYTTSRASDGAYDWMDGTSASAPIVSGAAALLWAAVPDLTASQAIDCLVRTARPLSTYSDTYHVTSGSAGALDAKAAVAYALETYGGTTTKVDISDHSSFVGYVDGTCVYDGSAQRPTVIFSRVGQGRLTQGVDYELSYENNVNVGVGVAVLHGIGDYRGTHTLTFPIEQPVVDEGTWWLRLSGTARYQTMEEIVSYGWVGYEANGAVVIATGADFKDALAACGLAGLSDAPVIITAKGELTPEAYRLLVALEPNTIYVAGGTAAVSAQTFNQIKEATGMTPKRLWGKNSASTSSAIALARSASWSNTAIIATNRSYKDALSAAPLSYALHMPILLAENGTTLNQDVLDALDICDITRVVIVGGEKAVTPQVVRQLKEAGISSVKRVWGSNAVQTSRKVAEWGLSMGLSPNGMGIATSKGFPDALCGAALCGLCDSVLLLADDDHPYNATFPSAYCAQMDYGFVFGGTSAVGMSTWDTLVACTRL